MKYKLLKPLPGVEVGTIYEGVDSDFERSNQAPYQINPLHADRYPDFFEPIKESKYWYPKYEEYYYYIDHIGRIVKVQCTDGPDDDCMLSIGNAFKTKEEAEKQLKLMQAIMRCRKYLIENDMLLSDNKLMDDRISKYTIGIYVGTGLSIGINQKFIEYSPYGYINLYNNAERFLKDCEEDLKLIHLPS